MCSACEPDVDGLLPLPAPSRGTRRRRRDLPADDVSRARVGDALVRRFAARPVGAFRLANGIPAPGQVGLAEAFALVEADWDRQCLAGGMKPSSVDNGKRATTGFARYAAAHGVTVLGDVTTALAQKYVDAPNSTSKHLKPSMRLQPPSVGTRHNRLGGLRLIWTTVHALGLDSENPTVGLVVPQRDTARRPRPITPAEDTVIRRTSRASEGETRRPAIVALARKSATTAELPAIRVRDLHLDAKKAWVHGGSIRTAARWVDLDDDDVAVLRRRVAHLATKHDEASLPDALVCYEGNADTGSKRQNALSGSLCQVFRLAGIADLPGVRPLSYVEYAAHRVWERTGRLEAVATALGMSSLDAVAEILALDWRDAHRTTGPVGVPTPDEPPTYAGVVWPPPADGTTP